MHVHKNLCGAGVIFVKERAVEKNHPIFGILSSLIYNNYLKLSILGRGAKGEFNIIIE